MSRTNVENMEQLLKKIKSSEKKLGFAFLVFFSTDLTLIKDSKIMKGGCRCPDGNSATAGASCALGKPGSQLL